MKRWQTILLTVSLVANVFLLGVIGGGLWYWANTPDRNGWRMRASDALPEPNATAFRNMIKGAIDEQKPAIDRARAAREEALRLYVQPKFDAAAVAAALDRAHAADAIVRTAIEHRVTAFAARLPQEQRKKLADAFKAGPFRQGKPR